MPLEDDDEDLPEDLQEVLAALNKEQNTKRKSGLKNLKSRLATIIDADDMQVQQKL